MLPAAHGDALLVEWGKGRELHRMLVDGGPAVTYRRLHDRIAALGRPRMLDRFVVTHIDGDHLEGVVRLLQDRRDLGLRIGDVWFNGWPQLATAPRDLLGPDQGDMLGALLIRDRQPWNESFGHAPVQVPATGDLEPVQLPGGARVTILGPGPRQLRDLRRNWMRVLRELRVTPGNVDAALQRLKRRQNLAGIRDVLGRPAALDNSAANASSISLLFEYEGQSLLLTRGQSRRRASSGTAPAAGRQSPPAPGCRCVQAAASRK